MTSAKRPLVPLEKLPPHLHKFVSAQTPIAAARLVVRGMVPLEGALKVCALYQVAHVHQELYAPAGELLDQMSAEVINPALTHLPPPILDWVAEVSGNDPEIAATLLAHPHSAVSTLVRLLAGASPIVAERLAANQVKLMSQSVLLQSLCLNEALSDITRDRLLELARFQGVDLSWLSFAQAQAQARAQRPASASHQERPSSINRADQALSAQEPVTSRVPIQKTSSALSLVGHEARAPSPSRLQHTLLPPDAFPKEVLKLLDPDAPPAVLNLVINGLFPMTSEVRVCALYQAYITHSSERDRIVSALRGLGAPILRPICASLALPELLDWLADHLLGAVESLSEEDLPEEHPDLISDLSLNLNVAEATIARIALYTTSQGCERLANNQQRLIQSPSVLHALYYNPKLPSVVADRILEFAAREELDLSWLPDAAEVLKAIHDQGSESRSSNHAVEEALQVALQERDEDIDPAQAAIQAVLDEHAARRAAQAPAEEGKPLKGYALIQSLNVAQKIRMALLGSQSDRALLIKDANKMVSRAAIRSPAVSVSEALLYARNHSLNASIIEYISTNRKWMQNYRVKVQIVLNPKTPVNVALTALNSLRPAELRSVAQSHGISGVVSARAKAIIKKRQG